MVLAGDALSQWLQRQHASLVRGSLVRLTPSGLPQVSRALDSHPVRVLLPVLRGGQAAVARAVVDGTQGPDLALRVQAVSAQAERVRQMERLVTMLTVAEATRADPARYPAVLPVLESFVVTVPWDQIPTAPPARYELWCDVMPWCPTTLAHAGRHTPDGAVDRTPSVVLTRIVPLVRTVQAVHEHLNVVHRDITPNNVLVDDAGRLLLADWGIAHTVADGQTSTRTQQIGNRGFSLPPEMLAGDQAVGRYTDAWYLGSLLFWMLTGQPPGPQHGADWLPPGLPGGPAGEALAGTVRGLCDPDPRRRTSLAEAASRLDHLRLAGPSDWAAPTSAARSPQRPGGSSWQAGTTRQHGPAVPEPVTTRRRRWPAAAVVVVVAVVLGAVAAWGVARPDQDPVASPSPTAASCWDDLSAGRCPDIHRMVLVNMFPLKDGVSEPECAEHAIILAEEPDSGNWMIVCRWPTEGLAVYLAWYRDSQAVDDYYRNKGFELDAPDVPSFADGPTGPVYSQASGQTMLVGYCYDDAPVCLETSGTPATIERTTDRFGSLTSDKVRRVTEALDAEW